MRIAWCQCLWLSVVLRTANCENGDHDPNASSIASSQESEKRDIQYTETISTIDIVETFYTTETLALDHSSNSESLETSSSATSILSFTSSASTESTFIETPFTEDHSTATAYSPTTSTTTPSTIPSTSTPSTSSLVQSDNLDAVLSQAVVVDSYVEPADVYTQIPDDVQEESEEGAEVDYDEEEIEEGDDDEEDSQRIIPFEEWRKQNLEKSGQNDYTDRQPTQRDADHGRGGGGGGRHMADLENIGDDLEIDANMFSGGEGNDAADEGEETENADRAVDSGKFYKDRFNYASFDCAATIIKTNKEAKGAHNILIENKDSYMLNKCNAKNKFVIVELCQDILVDTVIVGTFEFFSSMFRDIRISVSDRFPVPEHEWKILGEFEAKSIRDLQSFHIKNPLIWARYIRIEFLSHWGQEFYCPVSLLRVHGTTMMEEYKTNGIKNAGAKPNVVAVNKTQDANGAESKYVLDRTHEANNRTTDFLKEEYSKDEEDEESENEDEAGATADTDDIVRKVVDSPAGEIPGSSLDATCGIGVGNFSGVFFDSKPDFCSPIVSKRKPKSTATKPSTARTSSTPEQEEPTTQESIYQTIMKRIALLESNATLSMQYIESQTQTLLERVLRVDKKYELKIESFLRQLNTSLVAQFRAIDDQRRRISDMVQTKFHSQEILHHYKMSKMEEKLQELSDDLRYQKKVGIVQALILLVILGFVITTRGASLDASFFALGGSTPGSLHGSGSWKFQKRHKRAQKSATSDEGGGSGSGSWPPPFSATTPGTALYSPLYYSRASSPGLYHARSLPSLRGDGGSGGSGPGVDTDAVDFTPSNDDDDEDEENRPHQPKSPLSASTTGSKYEYAEIYYAQNNELLLARVPSAPPASTSSVAVPAAPATHTAAPKPQQQHPPSSYEIQTPTPPLGSRDGSPGPALA